MKWRLLFAGWSEVSRRQCRRRQQAGGQCHCDAAVLSNAALLGLGARWQCFFSSRRRAAPAKIIEGLPLAIKVIINGLVAADGGAGAVCKLGDDASVNAALSNTAAVSGVACLHCLCHCC